VFAGRHSIGAPSCEKSGRQIPEHGLMPSWLHAAAYVRSVHPPFGLLATALRESVNAAATTNAATRREDAFIDPRLAAASLEASKKGAALRKWG